MSIISVRVPVNGNEKERAGWTCNVSQHIDAGNDVLFVDDLDGTTPVNVHRIHVATAGNVNSRPKNLTDAQAQALYLIAGGWHDSPVGICKVLAADTSASIGIHVALG